MFVPTLVTVIIALGTNPPEVSFTSPVIVAVSCCAGVASGQANNNTKKIKLLMQRDNGLNISFLLWVHWNLHTASDERSRQLCTTLAARKYIVENGLCEIAALVSRNLRAFFLREQPKSILESGLRMDSGRSARSSNSRAFLEVCGG